MLIKMVESKQTSLRELIDTQSYESVGKPLHLCIKGVSLHHANVHYRNRFIEELNQKMPEGATGFVRGDSLIIGHVVGKREEYIPIQFYREATKGE